MRDLDRAGYYPQLVADVLDVALADEPVLAHLVHPETTFDAAEVRRHVTVLALTPSRLVVAHVDGGGATELTLAIGWGAVSRVDLEPAGCADPQCEADHGLTGSITPDDVVVRVSAVAEGADAVRDAVAFARRLSAASAR
jgi:hypothetical protein